MTPINQAPVAKVDPATEAMADQELRDYADEDWTEKQEAEGETRVDNLTESECDRLADVLSHLTGYPVVRHPEPFTE